MQIISCVDEVCRKFSNFPANANVSYERITGTLNLDTQCTHVK